MQVTVTGQQMALWFEAVSGFKVPPGYYLDLYFLQRSILKFQIQGHTCSVVYRTNLLDRRYLLLADLKEISLWDWY